MYSVAEPRSEEPKLNCLLESEPKLRIAALTPAPALSIYTRLEEIFRKKIMVAKEVFVNYNNFNPIWLQHACKKKYWYSSNCHGI
jgi:hypothetical protein